MKIITYRILRRFTGGFLALAFFLAVLTPPAAYAAGEGTVPSPQPSLTSADVAEMGRADASVAELTNSDAYAAMPLEERRDAAGEQLQALAEEELIEGDSIYYDEENQMFTFSYACGVLGGVLLRDLDEDAPAGALPDGGAPAGSLLAGNLAPAVSLPGDNGAANSLPQPPEAATGFAQAPQAEDALPQAQEQPPANGLPQLPEAATGFAQAPQAANALPQAQEPENRVLTGQLFGFADIYYAFDNPLNSSRYPYYAAMQQSWSEAGLATRLHTNLTVSRMKRIESSDLCVLSMHGSYYTYTYGRLWHRTITAPILILMEQSVWYKDLLYASDLLTHRVIKVNGLYCLLPAFFQHHYRNGELDGTIVFSETCDFFGYDCDSYELSSALLGAGARTVIGFRNTVYATYSRNVMWDAVNQLIYGSTVQQAVGHAMDRYGVNDVIWYTALSPKRPHALAAYPLWVGDGSARLELPY